MKAVRVQDNDGNVRMVKIKHGTEAADGSWDEVKTALPSSIKSADHDRIAEYVHAWAWRARRQGDHIFAALCSKSARACSGPDVGGRGARVVRGACRA